MSSVESAARRTGAAGMVTGPRQPAEKHPADQRQPERVPKWIVCLVVLVIPGAWLLLPLLWWLAAWRTRG